MKKYCCLLSFCAVLTLNAQGQTATPSIRIESVAIPGTQQTFKMAVLPAGIFQMGSPESEAGRDDDEGPQRMIQLDSFWIGVCEVTFDEFVCFQLVQNDSDVAADTSFKAAAIARPSPPYFDFTYGRGKQGGYPATTMTQQSALRYCQWLSDKTGNFYRLPTEAEWEYACKAGTTTAYSFGNDPKLLEQYAWFYDNSKGSYQKTGLKKPNPWGIYDLYGNAAEWTLDAYAADLLIQMDTSKRFERVQLNGQQVINNPWMQPVRKHSRTVRGGSFEDYAEDCRSSERRKSEPKWQARDPQIPKSRWWNPDSPFLGFRIVRDPGPWSKAERDVFFGKAIKD